MGTSRESYKLSHRLKNSENKLETIWYLIKVLLFNKYHRKLIFIDNIRQPYYKNIHCKVFGHKDFHYDSEDKIYYCKKCWKYMNSEQCNKYIRKSKIKKVI